MRDKKVLAVVYQSFNMPEPRKMLLMPYFLKEFKKRWYLFAVNDFNNDIKPHMYALDRILSADIGDGSFEVPEDFCVEEYFSNIYGIRNYDDSEV